MGSSELILGLWVCLPGIAVTLLVLGVIWGIGRIFNRKSKDAAARAARIVELMPPEYQKRALIGLVKLLEQSKSDPPRR